jgi:hypothetical protein
MPLSGVGRHSTVQKFDLDHLKTRVLERRPD